MVRSRLVIFIAVTLCAVSFPFTAIGADTPPLANRMVDVNIEGGVQKPGVYQLDEYTTIWAAIEAAGGLRKTAVDQVIFWRKDPGSPAHYSGGSWKRRAEQVPAPIVRDWPNIKIEDDPIPLAVSGQARVVSSTIFHLRKNAGGSFEKITFDPSVALQNLSVGRIAVPCIEDDYLADKLVRFQLEIRDAEGVNCATFESSPPRRSGWALMQHGEEGLFRLGGPFLLSIAAPGKYTAHLKVGVQASRHRPEITWITAAPFELSISAPESDKSLSPPTEAPQPSP